MKYFYFIVLYIFVIFINIFVFSVNVVGCELVLVVMIYVNYDKVGFYGMVVFFDGIDFYVSYLLLYYLLYDY